MTTTTTTYPPLPADTYSVRLVYSEPVHTTVSGKSYYLFSATVVDSLNLSPSIFVHQRKASDNPQEPYVDEFLYVAGPADLSLVSDTTPDARGFIRLATADILLPTAQLFEELKTEIQQRAQHLCDGLAALDVATAISTEVIQAPKP